MSNSSRIRQAMIAGIALGVSSAYAGPEPQQGGMHGPLEERMFSEVDANSDGAISRTEFDQFQARQFKRMDTDGDGRITREEMEAGHKNMQQKRSGTTHLDQRFSAADANHDGGLDRSEAQMMPMLTAYFDEVDKNKDGKVTRQEYFDAMPLLHRGKGMGGDGKPESL